MPKKKSMTKEDAARIQSHADKTGTNQDFKIGLSVQRPKKRNEDK